MQARDGGNNVLTGSDNANAGTDTVTVTVLEASGSVLDANLLGTKVYQLSGGSQTFADLGLQGDAGTHFRLRFSYNTLTVDSNEFNVKPNHMFVSVQPSDGQYGSSETKAGIGSGITVQARDGGNNLLIGADNSNAGTDTISVVLYESAGSVVQSSLIGSKLLFFSFGRCMFPDLFIQQDSGSGFRLEFSYNSLFVQSSMFSVHPFRLIFQNAPFSPLVYAPGNTFVGIGSSFSVAAVDGTGTTLSFCDNANDLITVSSSELGGIVPSLSGTLVKPFTSGVVVFSDLQLYKEAGTHFSIAAQSSSSLLRAGMDFFALNYVCCSAFTQQFSIRPFSYIFTSIPTLLRYPDDSVLVATSVVVSMTDGTAAVLVNAGPCIAYYRSS